MSRTQPPSEGNSRNPRKGPDKKGPFLDLGVAIGVASLAQSYLPPISPWFLHLGMSLGIGFAIASLIFYPKRQSWCLLCWLVEIMLATLKISLDFLSDLVQRLQEAMDKLKKL